MGAFQQGLAVLRGDVVVLFVPDFVLGAGPQIHGQGAQLHLHLHGLLLVVQENRHRDNQVQTPVAIGLGILEIVLALNQGDIVLAQEALGQHVDIRLKGAHHPHAGNVVDVGLDILNGQRDAPADELIHNALRGFQPGLDGLNGVALKGEGQILAENPELGLHLHQGAGIEGHHLPVWGGIRFQPPVENLGIGKIEYVSSPVQEQQTCLTRSHGKPL